MTIKERGCPHPREVWLFGNDVAQPVDGVSRMWASALLCFRVDAPPSAAKTPLLGRLHQTTLHRVALDVAHRFPEVRFIAHVAIAVIFLPELSGATEQSVRALARKRLP